MKACTNERGESINHLTIPTQGSKVCKGLRAQSGFGHEMLFRSQCFFILFFFFWSINIFVLWLLNIYPLCLPDLPTHPRRQAWRREEKDRKELFCLSCVRSFQVTSVCSPLTFHVLQLADERDTLFYTGRKTGSFLSLSPFSFKHGLTPNVALSSKHHPGPVPAGECQTVRCKALHPLKALHFKQSLGLFLYTACDMKATQPKPFTSLITIYFSFFW